MFCRNCGCNLGGDDEDENFCPMCGDRLHPPENPTEKLARAVEQTGPTANVCVICRREVSVSSAFILKSSIPDMQCHQSCFDALGDRIDRRKRDWDAMSAEMAALEVRGKALFESERKARSGTPQPAVCVVCNLPVRESEAWRTKGVIVVGAHQKCAEGILSETDALTSKAQELTRDGKETDELLASVDRTMRPLHAENIQERVEWVRNVHKGILHREVIAQEVVSDLRCYVLSGNDVTQEIPIMFADPVVLNARSFSSGVVFGSYMGTRFGTYSGTRRGTSQRVGDVRILDSRNGSAITFGGVPDPMGLKSMIETLKREALQKRSGK